MSGPEWPTNDDRAYEMFLELFSLDWAGELTRIYRIAREEGWSVREAWKWCMMQVVWAGMVHGCTTDEPESTVH